MDRFAIAKKIWTDEKKFTCGLRNRKVSYICRSTDPPLEGLPEMQKWHGGEGIMIWMGVSLEYGIFFFEFPDKDENGNKQTVNSQNFMAAMTRNKGFFNVLKRHQGASVVMDGSPVHNRAKSLFRNECVKVLPWPSRSPDLNVIGNIFSNQVRAS